MKLPQKKMESGENSEEKIPQLDLYFIKNVKERKDLSEEQMWRFKALLASFSIAEQLIQQKADQFKSEPSPSSPERKGYEGALEQIRILQNQAKENLLKHEGAFLALLELEESWSKLTEEESTISMPTEAEDPLASAAEKKPKQLSKAKKFTQISSKEID